MRTIQLTDANHGYQVTVRADHVSATSQAAVGDSRDRYSSTLVYTAGGNCLPVRELPEEVWRMVKTALDAAEPSRELK